MFIREKPFLGNNSHGLRLDLSYNKRGNLGLNEGNPSLVIREGPSKARGDEL